MTPDAQVRLLRVLQERTRHTRGLDARPAGGRPGRGRHQPGPPAADRQRRVPPGPLLPDQHLSRDVATAARRPADIAPLVECFAPRIAERHGPRRGPVDSVPTRFRALRRPLLAGKRARAAERGRVRQHRVSGRRGGRARTHLPPHIAGIDSEPRAGASGVVVTEEGISLRSAVTNLERELILQSLRLADGNKARAAELLELKRTTFVEKLRRMEQSGRLAVDNRHAVALRSSSGDSSRREARAARPSASAASRRSRESASSDWRKIVSSRSARSPGSRARPSVLSSARPQLVYRAPTALHRIEDRSGVGIPGCATRARVASWISSSASATGTGSWRCFIGSASLRSRVRPLPGSSVRWSSRMGLVDQPLAYGPGREGGSRRTRNRSQGRVPRSGERCGSAR